MSAFHPRRGDRVAAARAATWKFAAWGGRGEKGEGGRERREGQDVLYASEAARRSAVANQAAAAAAAAASTRGVQYGHQQRLQMQRVCIGSNCYSFATREAEQRQQKSEYPLKKPQKG